MYPRWTIEETLTFSKKGKEPENNVYSCYDESEAWETLQDRMILTKTEGIKRAVFEMFAPNRQKADILFLVLPGGRG